MSTMTVFVVTMTIISVTLSQNCSSYSTLDSALKGASHKDTTPVNGYCDNGLNNKTWYRFIGQYQQIIMTDTCVEPYHCNVKQTYALNASSKVDVSNKQYNVTLLIRDVIQCRSYSIAFLNVYKCDTFLLYNIPVFGGPDSPKPDCMIKGQYEPTGFCLDDTVKPLILSTELRHTFKLDKSTGPLKLNANATRGPTPPVISWTGGGTNITVEREGFKETIYNTWSEISIPSNAEYRNVQCCVDTTCRTFHLYTVEMKGVVQKDKVVYISATVKSNIAAMDISWQVGTHTYNSSEHSVLVNDGILKDGTQVASLTLYKNLDGLKDATISLTINDSSTATTVNIESIALCSTNTYFSKGSCKECPAKTVSPAGSITIEDCQQCKENTTFNVNTCTPCSLGTLKSGDCITNEVLPLSKIITITGLIGLLLIVVTAIIGVVMYKRTRADNRTLKYNVKNDG